MGSKKMRNLSYKKVEECKSGVLCLILCLIFLGGKQMWKKCILCVISVNAHNVVIVSRLWEDRKALSRVFNLHRRLTKRCAWSKSLWLLLTSSYQPTLQTGWMQHRSLRKHRWVIHRFSLRVYCFPLSTKECLVVSQPLIKEDLQHDQHESASKFCVGLIWEV